MGVVYFYTQTQRKRLGGLRRRKQRGKATYEFIISSSPPEKWGFNHARVPLKCHLEYIQNSSPKE